MLAAQTWTCVHTAIRRWQTTRATCAYMPSIPTIGRADTIVLGHGNGRVLVMLVPPAGGRACAWLRSRHAERGAVGPPCAPWPLGGVRARNTQTSRRALAPRHRTRSFGLVCKG